MFSSPIGRLRFFLYSVAIFIVEAAAMVVCIAATTGFDGLVHSRPGPSREGLALVTLVVAMLFVAVRTNITWRRKKDADLSKWLIVPYLVFLALFAVLQAGVLWTHDFNAGSSSGDRFGLLSIALFGLWFRICLASPVKQTFDPDAFLAAEGYGAPPSGRFRPAAAPNVPAGPSMRSAPATVSARGHGNASHTGFGKRVRG